MIEILDKISQNVFVFFPCRASSYKPPSARENNILPSLPLGSLGVVSLIASVYTYRGGGVITPTDPKGNEEWTQTSTENGLWSNLDVP